MPLTYFQPSQVDSTFNGYLRNRIINGAMMIDQRNAGASITPTATGTYSVDRWNTILTQASKYSIQQNAGGVTPPTGYINYLGATSLSAFSAGATDTFGIRQLIEGLNVADLAWGTSSAQTVTLSFWVRSSLTGTFGGSIFNNAGNRFYVFSYSINGANTWEYKTVTIPGDQSGTWLTTNGIGIQVTWSLGTGSTFSGSAGSWGSTAYYGVTGGNSVVGTNGATWYVTGVQLEVGSVATPFERRMYGTELMLCQRYYEKSYDPTVAPGTVTTSSFRTVAAATYSYLSITCQFRVTKRTAPTATIYSPNSGATAKIYNINAGTNINASASAPDVSGLVAVVDGVSVTVDQTCSVHWTASAEL